MSTYVQTLNNYLVSPIEVLRDLMRSYKKAKAHRRNVQQTIRELHSLTDKELADIGITRGDIRSVAEGKVQHYV